MDEQNTVAAGGAKESAARMDWTGFTIANYRVIEPLGRGGMGEVLLAQDLRLDRKVAIKVLPSEYTNDVERLKRFSQEARAASALNHPHIVAVYDLGDAAIGKYIVMEYVQGRTLRRACAESVSLDSAIQWSAQIARALAATHAAGIVHRDIKPENVMIRDDGYVKVLDFGLARRSIVDGMTSDDASTAIGVTRDGELLGTIQYMSPEQGRGTPVTPASDIFSLGIILYELVTGRHPFTAEEQISVLHAILSQDPISPSRLVPEIYGWLDALILRMLKKDPAERPTANQVANELESDAHHSESVPTARALRPFVGRKNERVALRQVVSKPDQLPGRLICLVGEAGIGKTTLVEEFVSELELDGTAWFIGHGRCSERLAGSEAYLPFLESLENLLRRDGDGVAARTLKSLAPTWYQRMSRQASTVTDEHAVSQERLKREIGGFLQALTEKQPLLLIFDDFHWADDSTIDMLAYIAGQFPSLRIVVLVTYRRTEMLLSRSPFLSLKLDLTGRSMCGEVNLEYLTSNDIQRYLSLVFPGHAFPNDFAPLVHSRTEGNALFMTDLIGFLKDRGVIYHGENGWVLTKSLADVEREMPESVRSIVQQKIEQLQDTDRKVLTAASVQGFDFDSNSVAQVLNIDPADLEEDLERLDRVHAFVRFVEDKELPNRTITLRYRFVHVLYQNALYGSLRPTRKMQWSLAMAEALLAAYGPQCSEIAANLAFLFEAARDFSRSADFCILAARNALQVFANKEAAALSRRCLELLEQLPPSASRTGQEMAAQLTLGVALTTLKGGYSDPEVAAAYGKALELCEGMGEHVQLLPVLHGLWSVNLMRSDYAKALELGNRMLPIAKSVQDPLLLTMSYNALGYLKPFIGDFNGAKADLEEMIRWHNRDIQQTSFVQFGAEPKTGALPALAWVCWVLGYADKARFYLSQAKELTEQVKHSVTVGGVKSWTAWITIEFEDFSAAKERAEEALAYGRNHDLIQTIVYAEMCHGVALAAFGEHDQGIEKIRTAVMIHTVTGCTLGQTLAQLSLTEALARAGKFAEAEQVLAEGRAFQSRSNERMRLPEFDRLAGKLLLMQSPDDATAMDKAAEYFQSSLAIAQSLQARSFELKTAIDLADLRRRQGRIPEARECLNPILNWFTEGLDTPLLQRAQSVARSL